MIDEKKLAGDLLRAVQAAVPPSVSRPHEAPDAFELEARLVNLTEAVAGIVGFLMRKGLVPLPEVPEFIKPEWAVTWSGAPAMPAQQPVVTHADPAWAAEEVRALAPYLTVAEAEAWLATNQARLYQAKLDVIRSLLVSDGIIDPS